MEGLRCLPSAAGLPEHVDLAVIAVPAPAVPEVAAECGRRGVRSLVVITSGLGPEGADLLAICRRHGMRLAGPNCFGVAVPGLGLDATFGAGPPAARRGGRGGPVRRGGRVAARAPVPARHRRVLVRLGRRQVRRVQQRHADLVGAGRADQARGAVRGVVRQPAQVRPHRPPGRPADAGADRDRRPLRRGPAGRRLAHRGRDHAAGHPGGAVRPGRHHRHAAASASWSRPPPCWPASRCRRATGSRSCPTPAGPGCSPPTPAATRPAGRDPVRARPAQAGRPAAAGCGGRGPGGHHRRRRAWTRSGRPGRGRRRRRASTRCSRSPCRPPSPT